MILSKARRAGQGRKGASGKERFMRNYLVFDAGGTFIKYALMDENAQILEKDKVSTPYFEDRSPRR